MQTIYIGIDPGASGAIALITSEGKYISIYDWPGNEQELAKILDQIDRRYPPEKWDMFAAIEKVGAMPARNKTGKPVQGIASTFKFGTNYGIWRMGLAMFKIPFILVTPQKWQKGIITKDDKMLGKAKGNCAAAARLFPDAPLYGPRGGAKDGRADALMIADWRRRN